MYIAAVAFVLLAINKDRNIDEEATAFITPRPISATPPLLTETLTDQPIMINCHLTTASQTWAITTLTWWCRPADINTRQVLT